MDKMSCRVSPTHAAASTLQCTCNAGNDCVQGMCSYYDNTTGSQLGAGSSRSANHFMCEMSVQIATDSHIVSLLYYCSNDPLFVKCPDFVELSQDSSSK